MSEALFWQTVLITTHLVTPILAVAICLWMKRGQVHSVSSGD